MAILRTMGFTEYLEQVRSEVEGDAFFRLLKSHLSAGNRVQKVNFVPAEGRQPPRYRFLLARLGTLTTVDVPAGGLAVERLLAETKQKLASREDEVRRCELRLRRAMEAVAQVLGRETARDALVRVSSLVGSPQSAQAARHSPHTNESSTTRLAMRHLRQELDALLLDLFAERGYPLNEAGSIMDEALARLIGAD
ncbi:MAG: hypothetical protein ACXU86_25395 [Archangium sp.]